MKIICNRAALLEAIMVAGNAVAGRTPKPVLQCIKISAEGQKLTVSATDLEVAIRYSEEQAQIDEPGEALVPADRLRDIIRESTDDTLNLSIEGEMMHIRGQDAHYKIYTQKAADFPPVPDFEGEPDFQVLGSQLRQLIKQTIFATAKDPSRYAFNGVLVVAKAKKVSFIATDGRRLALSRGDLVAPDKLDKEGKSAILPTKAMQLIEKLITDPEEPVQFQIRENQVLVHTAASTLTSNLVEGQFAPYEEVIPKEADKKLTASTADLLSAIRRASLLTTEDSKGIRLTFNKKGLVLSSRSPDAGEATVTFPAKFEGADIEIGFNALFMADALKVVDTDEIVLELTAPNRPGLIKSGNSFLYVIMPLNLP